MRKLRKGVVVSLFIIAGLVSANLVALSVNFLVLVWRHPEGLNKDLLSADKDLLITTVLTSGLLVLAILITVVLVMRPMSEDDFKELDGRLASLEEKSSEVDSENKRISSKLGDLNLGDLNLDEIRGLARENHTLGDLTRRLDVRLTELDGRLKSLESEKSGLSESVGRLDESLKRLARAGGRRSRWRTARPKP